MFNSGPRVLQQALALLMTRASYARPHIYGSGGMCEAVVTEVITVFHSPPRYLTSAGHLSTGEAEWDTPSWKLPQGVSLPSSYCYAV